MIFAFLLLITELPLLAVVAWNVLCWPRVTAAAVLDGKISVLIPARNEAANIGECLACVVARDGVIKEILIYDDHSTDATPRIVVA